MKLIMGITAILLPVLSIGQPGVQPLTIGDTVPGVTAGTIINYAKPAVALSSFKGRLVLLDFMNTYCSNCIAALPALDSLQHKYGDRLQIFMVTSERRARVEKFMKANPIAKTVSLPFIIEDTVLEKLFPHYFVSHEAWIYDGVVKAITAADYVTEENILTVLSGKTPAWEVKNDIGEFNYDASLLTINDNVTKYATNNTLYGSVCTSHLKGVALRCTEEADSITGAFTIKAINYPIAALYVQTLTQRGSFPRSHVLLEQGNEGFFNYPGKNAYRDVWEEKNTYCYEATFPPNTSKAVIRKKVQTDLDVYLQVQSSFETRGTLCYVLERDTAFTGHPSTTEDYTTLSSRASKDELVFMSPDNLVNKLNDTYWGTPFYSGIPASVRMAVILTHSILTDIHTLKNELKKKHLLLKEITRDAEMLVLKKNQNNL